MEQIFNTSDLGTADSTEVCCKFLTTFAFVRGGCGLRVSVVGCMELVEFSNIDDMVRGYIEYRGDKIAVIDPRLIHDSHPTPIDSQTCIVLVEPEVSGKRIRIGVIVEDLSEVLNIASYKMDKSSRTQGSANINFILEIGREDDSLTITRVIDASMRCQKIEHRAYRLA